MNAQALYQAGQLDEAIAALGAEVREHPLDLRRRTFLFELLCFNGDYDRAEKQLDVLAQGGQQAELGSLFYRSALHAERLRQEMFTTGHFPLDREPHAVSGTINGRSFGSLTDADPRIGARLEVFVAGQYVWLPLELIASVRMEPPARLRDLLWIPAIVTAAPALRDIELGEVLVPALTPLSYTHPDGPVRLGRVTAWQSVDPEREAPVGQKMLLVDGEEFPILELRELDIVPVPAALA